MDATISEPILASRLRRRDPAAWLPVGVNGHRVDIMPYKQGQNVSFWSTKLQNPFLDINVRLYSETYYVVDQRLHCTSLATPHNWSVRKDFQGPDTYVFRFLL